MLFYTSPYLSGNGINDTKRIKITETVDNMKVAIVMGSASDREVMKGASEILSSFGIEYEQKILSAHRTPVELMEWVHSLTARGFGAVIAGAGCAAHLAGVVASHTTIPVIGVPLKAGVLDGLDALLATVQMPSGIPVATVAINGAKNAALLSVEILALGDKELTSKLESFRKEQAGKVLAANEQ